MKEMARFEIRSLTLRCQLCALFIRAGYDCTNIGGLYTDENPIQTYIVVYEKEDK